MDLGKYFGITYAAFFTVEWLCITQEIIYRVFQFFFHTLPTRIPLFSISVEPLFNNSDVVVKAVVFFYSFAYFNIAMHDCCVVAST